MSEKETPVYCPECEEGLKPVVDRRNFIRVVGGTAAAVTLGGSIPGLPGKLARADEAPKTEKKEPKETKNKAAEELIKELFADLKDEQKKQVVKEYDHKQDKAKYLTRHRIFNGPMGVKIESAYSKPQQELVEKILKAVSAGDELSWKCMSRNDTWDNSGAFGNCGAYIFGDPTTKQWAWVFTGHHLTVRCDGNSEDGPAFGGPIYYGHTPNPYSDRNCFYYQTKEVLNLLDALDEKQRKVAIVKGTPGELEESVTIKKDGHPGVAFTDLSKDQKGLVDKVMRTILSPYRKEDVDEVMSVIKATGGMEKIHFAWYPDKDMKEDMPWAFWRLEGPGFVWNFRVMPHVHTYVNISTKLGAVT